MAINRNKLIKRIAVVIFLVPIFIFFVDVGGLPFVFFWSAVLVVASWEYWRLFKTGNYSPSLGILVLAILSISIGRYLLDTVYLDLILSSIILICMIQFIIAYENGSKTSAVDFAITIGGVFYIGWIGAYLISLRMIENGKWWLLLVIPAVWFTDVGGYFIGSWLGKRRLTKKVSPNKTVEGYIGGIIFSLILTYLLCLLWNMGNAYINPNNALVLGMVIGVFTPLGDLGESMLKRQFNIKDTSNLLPGHGGILDRIDTWLWAGVLGYFLILLFF